ncbi:unnamed protein product [Alternaria alternata]
MSKRSISSPSPPPEAKRLQEIAKGSINTIYEPLPQGEFIRVLKLQPGKAEDDIECSLEIIDIGTSKDSYEAISYVWGDSNHTVEVWCNGLQVPVTASLANALYNFRHSSEPRLLWADALCINQKDDQEKGHQVKRMGEVYANAKCVLVWLACDTKNVAEDTFALICEVNAYFGASFVKGGERVCDMELFEEPYPISMDQDRWSGVVKLFKLPWFKRVWTVQEAAVAAECRMFWGLASVDIADVIEICVWFWAKEEFYAIIRGIVGNIAYCFPRKSALYFHYNTHRPVSWQQSRVGLVYLAVKYKEKTLCKVLDASQDLEATDPRDHVYAFLGCPVAKDGEGRTLVDADYTSSLHVLNIRLAHALMKSPTEGPFVLSAVYHRTDGRLGIIPVGKLVEVGDVCCIIFGATVPFLLTPAKDGRHKLISECYIHGVMDGEVMQQFAGSDVGGHRIVLG